MAKVSFLGVPIKIHWWTVFFSLLLYLSTFFQVSVVCQTIFYFGNFYDCQKQQEIHTPSKFKVQETNKQKKDFHIKWQQSTKMHKKSKKYFLEYILSFYLFNIIIYRHVHKHTLTH